jgi:hypothetical protein
MWWMKENPKRSMPAMDDTRWKALMQGESELTADEIALGWHFCPEWDGLLIGHGMGEIEVCLCNVTCFDEADRPNPEGEQS